MRTKRPKSVDILCVFDGTRVLKMESGRVSGAIHRAFSIHVETSELIGCLLYYCIFDVSFKFDFGEENEGFLAIILILLLPL